MKINLTIEDHHRASCAEYRPTTIKQAAEIASQTIALLTGDDSRFYSTRQLTAWAKEGKRVTWQHGSGRYSLELLFLRKEDEVKADEV